MKRILLVILVLMGVAIGGQALAAKPGDLVLGKWGDGFWYPARVAELQGGKVLVSFYDGDVASLPRARIKAFRWKKGTRVQCNWKRRGKYYNGKIAQIKVEWVHIFYDDGDKEKTGIGRCRSR